MMRLRLPDLWLKIDLASSVAWGGEAQRADDQILAECTIRRHLASRAQTFSKMTSGDLMIALPELRNLAAALELAITRPLSKFSVEDAQALADSGAQLALFPDAILGTFQSFCAAIIRLAPERGDRQLLTEIIRREIRLLRDDGKLAPIRLVIDAGSGPEIGPIHGAERIVGQPDRMDVALKPGGPIQILAPPHASAQLLFGFEIQDDEALIDLPWSQSASWLGARYQPAGRAGRLVDNNSRVAETAGSFWVQALGIDRPPGFKPRGGAAAGSDEDLLPSDMMSLIRGAPTSWPTGYAKAIALLTFASRQKPATSGLRLYQGSYRVAV